VRYVIVVVILRTLKTIIMKYKFLILSFIFNFYLGYAQDVKITYSLVHQLNNSSKRYYSNKAIKLMEEKEYHFLIKQNEHTLFFPYEKPKNLKVVDTTVVSELKTNIFINIVKRDIVDIYYLNHKNKYYIRKLDLHGEKFDIKDSIPQLKWTILDEKDKLNGYTIQKATTVYHGISITAWFTEEIPISIGPRIYTGLPGLIMKLEQGFLIYQVEKIEFLKDIPTIIPPKPYRNYLSSHEFLLITKKNKKGSTHVVKKCATCPDNQGISK
jgi:GLPGLI family protein